MARAEHTVSGVISGVWHLISSIGDGLPIAQSDQGEPDVDSHKRTYEWYMRIYSDWLIRTLSALPSLNRKQIDSYETGCH